MNTIKKILIFYTSVGLGHKSMAENIGAQLSAAGYEVSLKDILQVQSGTLPQVSVWAHQFVNNYMPWLWSWLYKSVWFTETTLPYRTKVAAKNHLKTLALIQESKPDLVICTQTTASAIVSFLKEKKLYTGKFGIAFSDFHLHRYWLYDNADVYLCNIEEQKMQMEELGIPAEKIFVCGMTLKPKIEVNVNDVKLKLGIAPGDRVVLVGSGSLGSGMDKGLLLRLSQQPNVKVIAVCGKNQTAFNELSEFFAGSTVTILGFYTPMDELYAVADIFVTKPGGLSTSESLRWNLPILLSHFLPGQEELNVDYLEDKGLVMPGALNIESEALEEIQTHAFRKRLAANPAKAALFPEPEVLVSAVRWVGQNSQ